MLGARRRGARSTGVAPRRAVTVIIGAMASLWFTASATPVLAAPVCFDTAGNEVPCATPSTRAPGTTTPSRPATSAAATTTSTASTTTTTVRTTTTTGEANAGGGAVLRVNPPRSRPHSSSHTKTIVAIVSVVFLVLLALVVPEVRARRRRTPA